MTAVTIRGTFSKDTRPSNGLEEIADDLLKKQFEQYYVVGVVQFAGGTVPGPGEGLVPAVKFLGIEPLQGGLAATAKDVLDKARQARGLGAIEDTFTKEGDPALFDFDEDGGVTVPGETNASGEPVPPPSAEELAAEKAEASVPAATFSGGKK